jgi:hypothetical protein
MMEAVHRYEGTVNQVMGDGIMALFGAPLAHEDHAVRACYAALRMQESVKQYADEVRRSHAAVVKIRVGLNSGEVVVRAIGSDLHTDYTAVGQTTHLAARMEQLADPGGIVITPATLGLAEGYIEVKSIGPVAVKGLTETVEIYEVTGAGRVRSRCPGLSPLWRPAACYRHRPGPRGGARHPRPPWVGAAPRQPRPGPALARAHRGHGVTLRRPRGALRGLPDPRRRPPPRPPSAPLTRPLTTSRSPEHLPRREPAQPRAVSGVRRGGRASRSAPAAPCGPPHCPR